MERRILLPLILLLFIFSGCEEKNADPVLIIIPNQIYLVGEPEDVLTFDIRYEGDVDARRLTITSKEEGSFTRTVLDSVVSGRSFTVKYEYPVPIVNEEMNLYIEFLLETASGEILRSARIIEVNITERILSETAGHEMFSKASEKQNAYNLILGNPLYSHLSDSNLIHIMDTTDSDVLLRKWFSPASSRFVRYNGYDYANASNRTMKEAFNSGLKYEFLIDIKKDDIIIARFYNNTADSSYSVVKVTDVVDLPGKVSDKYVFNIKR
ncbi:hypothetical protein ACFLTU_02725 [Bacteroidota bacterium]